MKRSKTHASSRFRTCRFETLEGREMRSATPNDAAVASVSLADTAKTVQQAPVVTPDAITSPNPSASLLSPSQVRSAYGLNQVSSNGAGTTIALIEVGNDPAIQNDVNVFDTKYNLPNLQVNIQPEQLGYTPPFIAAFAREEALDIEWAHVAAPGAKIEVFEANSTNDIYTEIDAARHDLNVSVISISLGWAESVDEAQTDDSHFTTPANHQPITFIASTGDLGEDPEYPAASPNVLAVGGTQLTLSNGAYSSETAWNDSNGGPSYYESKPSYQSAITLSTNRMTPDVSFDASLTSGVNVYHSAEGGWVSGGGTSLGAPFWAGIVADANQARNAAGIPSLGHVQADVYSFKSSDFNDVTTGANMDDKAKVGYDLVTGLGTPKAQNLIPDLVKAEPPQVAKLPTGGSINTEPTTPTTPPGNATLGGSTSKALPADPTAETAISVDISHSTAQISEPVNKQAVVPFDLLMASAHDDDDADQAVDALFYHHDFGRLHS